jgi:hypothetical protein
MRKDLKRNLYLLLASITLAVFSFRAVASTLASAQGPTFQGPVAAPSFVLNQANTTTTCVGDGGFTNCVSGLPQQQTVSQIQSIVSCNLDGGTGNSCILYGSATSALADAGIQLPGLSANSMVVCQLSNPSSVASASLAQCVSSVQAPGGDGGVVVVTCNMANAGSDGGQANCFRLN